ncbi:hypothetical protein [Asticcacaulis sp. MM231]|uniref:hypothetical protein n=1 Tax=Asticcacaulis sp. MM231 TaxID=3157666 RepID=UPI0032D5A1BE
MKISHAIRFISVAVLVIYWGGHLLGELKPGISWQQVFVTDWYVTVLVLCMPVMLLVWFAFEKRRELKAEE